MDEKKELMGRVRRTIKEYDMISRGDRVIVGVSGGADSVCLLAALRECGKEEGFSLTAVHVEHGLRGEESLDDAAFVEQLCRQWEIPCRVEHIPVKERALASGQTLEEAGREARYQVFEKWRKKLGARRIAVAHNENDQAETVLLNLARGSGLRGMGGIRPVRDRIIRPLLFLSREEIEDWLRQQKIPWRVDATNLTADYTRNKLRLQGLPWLEREINTGAVRHLASAAFHLQRAEEFLERQAKRLFDTCARREGPGGPLVLSLSGLLDEEEVMQEYVLRMAMACVLGERGLKDYGEVHIRQMMRLCRMDCGRRMDFPGGLRAWRRRGELVLEAGKPPERRRAMPGENPEQEICRITGNGSYTFQGHRFQVRRLSKEEAPCCFPEKKYTKWLAYDTITDNICLRTRRTGDYLIVNREGGRKKLKDYLIDRKIPREERDRVILLAQGSHILWVVGWRISEDAKVAADTKRLIEIQMMEDEYEGSNSCHDFGGGCGPQNRGVGCADQQGL